MSKEIDLKDEQQKKDNKIVGVYKAGKEHLIDYEMTKTHPAVDGRQYKEGDIHKAAPHMVDAFIKKGFAKKAK